VEFSSTLISLDGALLDLDAAGVLSAKTPEVWLAEHGM
jgi:hypothetical protein